MEKVVGGDSYEDVRIHKRDKEVKNGDIARRAENDVV